MAKRFTMSDEHMNANKYLKGRFINIGNIITDTTNNWQFQVEMEQTNEDSVFADTISVLTFLNQFAEENEELKIKCKNLIKISARVQVNNDQLKEENEELKQQNKMLRTNIEKLTGDVKYLQNLPSEHRELYKQSEAKRVNLLKENMQLKQENIELIKYGKELLEYINTSPKHRKSIFDAVVYFKKKNEETINVNIDSEIQSCKNCKHLGLDGMFGLICDANGNNKNHDCPKYKKERGREND